MDLSNINYELIFTTSTIATLFFAIPIFVSMVIVRYSTLAKLIRDSREEVITYKIDFKPIKVPITNSWKNRRTGYF